MVAALARLASTKPAGAVAIDNLLVSGDVENAQILLGYKKEKANGQTTYSPKNPDASSGKVVVNGNWTATSLVAVSALVDPRMLVEIEADAIIDAGDD